MILKRILLITFLIMVFVPKHVYSQDEDFKNLKFKDRLFFGGNFWLSFGNSSYVNISPIVGYRITPRLSGGVGPIYIYEKSTYFRYETSTYGGKTFFSYDLFRNLAQYIRIDIGDIILHAENEVVNTEIFKQDYLGYFYSTGNRIWIDNLLLGGGISQHLGKRASVNIFILWDVTHNIYSNYSNPILRFGFNF